MLCKSCASRRRGITPTSVVQLSENLAVTSNVEKRLRRNAEAQIPKDMRYYVPAIASILTFLCTMAIFPFYYRSELPKPDLGDFALVVGIGWIVFAILLSLVIADKLSPMQNNWKTRVNLDVLDKAVARAEKIEGRGAFYASSEWKALRSVVIREDGKSCAICGRDTIDSSDVTVDHILPRSKYPHLALNRSNLRVLCRSCNSAKGDAVEYNEQYFAQQAAKMGARHNL